MVDNKRECVNQHFIDGSKEPTCVIKTCHFQSVGFLSALFVGENGHPSSLCDHLLGEECRIGQEVQQERQNNIASVRGGTNLYDHSRQISGSIHFAEPTIR